MKTLRGFLLGVLLAVLLSTAISLAQPGDEWEFLFAVYRHRQTGEIRIEGGVPDSPTPTITPAGPISPTPEPPIPTITPHPTLPPLDEQVCMAGVATVTLNVRADHTVTASVLRKLAQGTRVQVVELYIRYAEGSPQREEWALLAEGGWIALWYNGGPLAVLDDTPSCWELPKTYAENPLPTGGGFHVLPGAGAGAVVAYADRLSVIKCLDGSWWVCESVKAANPDVHTVARTLATDYGMIDCPQEWNWGDPAAWWNAIKGHLPDGYDYYEVMNECGFPPQGAEYLATWSIEMAGLVQRDKGGALLAFSFSPGNPNYAEWPALLPYLQWAADNPLPDGRRHGIALHASAYAPWNRADSPWINNPHVTPDRFFVYARDVILANRGVDIGELQFTVIFTELGVTDGYSGSWGASYTCAEKASAYRETVARLPGAMAWWNIGQIARWTSDHDCLAQMLL